MPLPAATLGAIITGGGDILSQGINALVQSSQNRKMREFSEKMYGRQRADALADWTMQNEYNHPTQQMKRLVEAKLNPNLVYGTGAVANNSGQPRAASVESWRPTAPQFDIGGALGHAAQTFMDVKIKEAQYNNLQSQAALNTMKEMREAFDLGLKKEHKTELEGMIIHKLRQQVAKADQAEADVTMSTGRHAVWVDQNLIKTATMRLQYDKEWQTMEKVEREMRLLEAKTNTEKEQLSKVKAEVKLLAANLRNAILTGNVLTSNAIIREIEAKVAPFEKGNKLLIGLRQIFGLVKGK